MSKPSIAPAKLISRGRSTLLNKVNLNWTQPVQEMLINNPTEQYAFPLKIKDLQKSSYFLIAKLSFPLKKNTEVGDISNIFMKLSFPLK